MSNSIRARLVIWFLLIGLVPITVVTVALYIITEQSLRREVFNNIETVANTKATQIETYIAQLQSDITTLARLPTVVFTLRTINNNVLDAASYQALDENIRPFLSYYVQVSNYANLLLLTDDNQVRYQLNSGDLAADLLLLERVAINAKTLLQTESQTLAQQVTPISRPRCSTTA
jgi:hypothetical protein